MLACKAALRSVSASADHVPSHLGSTPQGVCSLLVLLQDRNAFRKVHQETFGKSGCRRITPGQLLASDPKGRACMIGAVEKQKLVYVLNRDAAANLTISSPLEAHKSHHLVFALAGLDMGFDNPVFAAIELDYADADQVRKPGWLLQEASIVFVSQALCDALGTCFRQQPTQSPVNASC